MKPSNPLEWVVALLVIVGSINWGLVGLLHMNLVSMVLGDGTNAARAVYTLVGLAGLWTLINTLRNCSK